MNAQEYIEKETQNVHWLNKHLGRVPVVKTTRQLASDYYSNYGNQKTYSISLLFIITTLLPGSLVILWLLFLMSFAFLDNSTNPLPYLLVLVALGTGLYFIIKNIGKTPSSVYRMTISGEGINLGRNICEWFDIEDTLLSTRPWGSTTKTCLVLLMKGDSVIEIDLYRLGYSERELAACIEHYRATALSTIPKE